MKTTARTFWSYIQLLCRRPDLQWDDNAPRSGQQPEFILAEGLDASQAKALEDRVPADMLAFYRHFNGGGFHYREGPQGVTGGLDLTPLDPARFQTYVYGDEPFKIGASWMMENVNDAWYCNLVCDPEQTTRDGYIAFYANVDADRARKIGSFEDYLRAGAKRGFVFFWQDEQNQQAAGYVTALLEASAPVAPPNQLANQLQKLWGLQLADAEVLVDWLGDRAVLLLPKNAPTAQVTEAARSAIEDFDAA